MTTSRAERLARNEAVFRQVNESIRDLGDRWETDVLEIVCECSQVECVELLRLTPREYAAVRASGDRFAIVEGHEEPDVERIVERTDRFVVIVKLGEGAAVAQALDPRAGNRGGLSR